MEKDKPHTTTEWITCPKCEGIYPVLYQFGAPVSFRITEVCDDCWNQIPALLREGYKWRIEAGQITGMKVISDKWKGFYRIQTLIKPTPYFKRMFKEYGLNMHTTWTIGESMDSRRVQ